MEKLRLSLWGMEAHGEGYLAVIAILIIVIVVFCIVPLALRRMGLLARGGACKPRATGIGSNIERDEGDGRLHPKRIQ